LLPLIIPLPTHPASSGRGGVPGCGWPPAAPPPPPLPPGGSAPLLPRIGWRGLDGFLRALVSNPSLPRTDTLVAREPVWCPARSAHFFPSLSVAGFVCQAVPQRPRDPTRASICGWVGFSWWRSSAHEVDPPISVVQRRRTPWCPIEVTAAVYGPLRFFFSSLLMYLGVGTHRAHVF